MHRGLMSSVLSILLISGCHWVFSSAPDAASTDAMPDAKADAADSSGCSDGTREGFESGSLFPKLAGCEGAWSIAGLRLAPICGRQNGNDLNPSGANCAASDLCAPGWAICSSRDEIATCLGAGSCVDATTQPQTFFATSVGSKPSTSWSCDDQVTSTDDLYGCGTAGGEFSSSPPSSNTCPPLTKSSDNACSGLDTTIWQCAGPNTAEQLNVTKKQGVGGVLCCKQ